MPPVIRPVDPLMLDELQPLLSASVAEGYSFVEKLWDEYQSGVQQFDAPGAVLLGAYNEGSLVAIGGVHPDPYLDQPNIGRIRHMYVLPEWRRTGVGRLLMTALIEHAARYFKVLTLRTPTAHGDAFYTALGFSRERRFDHATHWLALE